MAALRGRKPKPTHLKVLEGNPGKRALNKAEPTFAPPPPDFDDVPEMMAAFPHAVAEWRRLVPLLRTRKAVTEADRSALIALCLEWHRYLEAMAKIETTGLLVKTPSGYPMPNPYLAIATKALSACAKLWPELGLTPSSRSRVRVEGGPVDEFAEFDEPLPAAPVPPPRTTTH